MDITLERDALLSAVTAPASIAGSSTTMPVLTHLLLQADDTRLRVTGTDTEVFLTTTTDLLTCRAPGTAVIPARDLLQLIKQHRSDAQLSLCTDTEWMTITTATSRYRLPTLPPDDYPQPKTPQDAPPLDIPAPVLTGLLSQCAYAMAVEDVRFYLNGAYLEGTSTGLTVVATDGHRLATITQAIDGMKEPLQLPPSILPYKAVLMILRHFSKLPDAVIRLARGEGLLQLDTPELTLHTLLIDARYPDYRRVIPPSHRCQSLINRAPLIQSLQRMVSIQTQPKGIRGGRFEFRFNALFIECDSPNQASGEETLPVLHDDAVGHGPAVRIGLNLDYLIDALNAIPGDRVEIHYHDPDTAILIRRPDQPTETHILMPMRV